MASELRRIVDQLRTLPALADDADDRLARLAALMRPRTASAGAVIFSRNDRGGTLCLLVRGRARTTLVSADGREFTLSYIDAPTQFSATTAQGTMRAADVVAVTDVELLMIDAADLERAFQVDPRLAIEAVSTLSLRLGQALDSIQALVFSDAGHRVMRVLLDLAAEARESVGAPVIAGMTHYEIGTLAGTSRETASRTISSLAKKGVVLTRGRKIFVDLHRLREESGSDD